MKRITSTILSKAWYRDCSNVSIRRTGVNDRSRSRGLPFAARSINAGVHGQVYARTVPRSVHSYPRTRSRIQRRYASPGKISRSWSTDPINPVNRSTEPPQMYARRCPPSNWTNCFSNPFSPSAVAQPIECNDLHVQVWRAISRQSQAHAWGARYSRARKYARKYNKLGSIINFYQDLCTC